MHNRLVKTLCHFKFFPNMSRTYAGQWVPLVATHATMCIHNFELTEVIGLKKSLYGGSSCKLNNYTLVLGHMALHDQSEMWNTL